MSDFTPNRHSRFEVMQALYRVFGFGSLAVTAIGFLACVGVVYIALYRDVTWATIVVVGSFPCLLLGGGLWSLWERWLSFGVVEGFRPATFAPRTWLRVLSCALLCSLAIALLCAATSDALPTDKRGFALALVACSLIVAGIPLAFLVVPTRYWLVREGLAVRHCAGYSLIPWDAIGSTSLGASFDNPAVVIQFEWTTLPVPLPTVWKRELEEIKKERIQQKLLKGFGTAARWSGANLLIMGVACGMPPGVFLVRLNEALQNPVVRNTLPPFSSGRVSDATTPAEPAGGEVRPPASE